MGTENIEDWVKRDLEASGNRQSAAEAMSQVTGAAWSAAVCERCADRRHKGCHIQ